MEQHPCEIRKSQFWDIFNGAKPNVGILKKIKPGLILKLIVYSLCLPNFMIHLKVPHGELISSMLHFLALAKHSLVHKQVLYHNVNIIFPDSLNWCHFDPIDIYIYIYIYTAT